MVQKILLANPRGYCAGVVRAIQIAEMALEQYGTPIYIKHQIVHNNYVVQNLEKKGAIFVETLSEIPDNAKVIFSAHGSPPKDKQDAENRGLKFVDAVCPFVTKIHVEARKYHRNGYQIILIGHGDHIEVKGTMGYAPMTLVETAEDVEKLELQSTEKMVYLTQTTLSVDETKDIINALKQKFPNITAPHKADICYATTNRQGAVKVMTQQADLVLVVGSKASSNSNRLVDTAKDYGTNSYLIDDKMHIQEQWLDGVSTLGLTSGASVSDHLVKGVITHIQEKYPECEVQLLEYADENVKLSLPDKLFD